MNQRQRAPWHDYTQRCIYMVTLNKSPHIEEFGTLKGDYRIPHGQAGCPTVEPSLIGKAIKEILHHFDLMEPKVKIIKYALMPDHLHILLFVTEPIEDTLGRVIARFKNAVNKAAATKSVFAKGFNDQILKRSRSLDTLIDYLSDNPRRLAVRRAHPEYFRRVNHMEIEGMPLSGYGNFELLGNPFKIPVVVHRADSNEIRPKKRAEWLYVAANGGVLVSPFISVDEKAIRTEAEELGGHFIHITNRPIDDRFKPSGRDFELCEEGRLLIVSIPGIDDSVTRPLCLAMNRLAEEICKMERNNAR